MSLQNWKLWAPMISGFCLSALCNFSKNDGLELPQRPPSVVFKIVWPILYILLGLSWTNSKSTITDLMHYICTFLLALWIFVYNCKNMKKMGIYIIACTIATVISLISLHENKISKVFLLPLLAWLQVAYLLNWNIVD